MATTTSHGGSVGWRELWAREKCDLAIKLANGHINGSYAEAVLILCAALNAFAAEVWPKRPGRTQFGDIARFVEALVTLTFDESGTRLISVPMLVERLIENGHREEAEAIGRKMMQYCVTRVLTGSDCDATESEVQKSCPYIDARQVRACSYANLLYREVRSAYSHEYQPGASASAWPMTSNNAARVSYVNMIYRPRQIHFHLPWLVEVVLAVAKSIDGTVAGERALPTDWRIRDQPASRIDTEAGHRALVMVGRR